jgi:hypothetical protein|tara:strand:+ start:2136 stop:2882 length:747 start_codon:yes stop_codon:yes gene_type:complete
MKLFKDIYKFLLGEQVATNKDGVPKYLNNSSSRPGSIANAVKKRNPVSFFYNGPRNTVQAGKRVKAELVALGLSKKGNMVVRAWVDQPSKSKTGFQKGNWRTFMVGRMNQVEIYDEETFDQKREGYKEGDDKSMSVTYVTSDWSSTPEPQTQEPVQREPQTQEPEVEPIQREPQTQEPDVEPIQGEPDVEPTQQRTSTDLPDPEPDNTPSIEPPIVDDNDDDEDQEDNNYDNLNESINRIKELLYNSK